MPEDLLTKSVLDGSLSFEAFNAIALALARRFESGELSFEEADHAACLLYGLMVKDASEQGDGFVFAEPAFSIYEAFDLGEYYDTSLASTRTKIKEILQG